MSRYYLFIILFMAPLMAQAQEHKILKKLHIDGTGLGRHSMHADSLLTRSYKKQGSYDTAYITRPVQAFTVKLRYNVAGSSIRTKGQFDGRDFNSKLTTSYQNTVSFALAYRGLSVAFAVNPDKLLGKDKSKSFNFTLYANRYGMDLAYQDCRDYTGWSDYGGTRQTFTTDLVHTQLTNMNAYYAFNYRHFSYPAALTQSYIQHRSAGSWLLALSCINGVLTTSPSDDEQLHGGKLRLADIGVGGGYGYNWVLPHRWMIHGSLLPTAVVGSFNRMTMNGEKTHLPYAFPEMIVTERLSFLHYLNERHFLNLTFVNYTTIHDSTKHIRNVHNKWRLRVCYGFRF